MAAHKLPRLSKSLLDTPQLITESKFREIAEVLENHGNYSAQSSILDYEESESVSTDLGYGDNIGVLSVNGPLTYKPTGWEMLCGEGCSYTSLMSQIDQYAAQGIKTVVMKLDSPGGQAFRAFSTSRYIRKVCDENAIHLIGYVDGLAASAGYVLASACHELVSNGDSECGSIGVVVSLVDTSEKDKKEGIKRIFITSDNDKVPYDDDGSYTKEFKQDIKDKVLKTKVKFIEHVSSMRAIDSQLVKDIGAKVFDAETALSLGLIDSIMEEDDFKRYISSFSAASSVPAQQLNNQVGYAKMNVVETQPNLKIQKETTLMSDMNITPEMFAKLQTQLESLQAENASYKAKAEAEAKAALSTKLDNISFLAECKEDVLNFFMSADEVSTSLMNTVLSAAQAESDKVLEEAASQVAAKQDELTAMEASLQEAKQEAEAAKAEALSVKEEFGKQEAIEGCPKDKNVEANVTSGAARTAQLAALVKSKTANK